MVKKASTSKLPQTFGALVNARLEDGEQVLTELTGDLGTGICLSELQLIIVRSGYRATGIPWGRRVFAFPRYGVETISPHFSVAPPRRTPKDLGQAEIRFGMLLTGTADSNFTSVFFYAGLERCNELSSFICRSLHELWDDGRKAWPGKALSPHKQSDLPGGLGDVLGDALRATEHILAELATSVSEGVVLTDQRLLGVRAVRQGDGEAELRQVPLDELTEVRIGQRVGPTQDASVLDRWLGQGGMSCLSIEPMAGDEPCWEDDPPQLLDLDSERLTLLAEFFTQVNGELVKRG